MNTLKKLSLSVVAAAVTVGAMSCHGSTLTLIPIPSWLTGTNENEGRAITRDGKYVVGVSGNGAAGGYLYDVVNDVVRQPAPADAPGAVPSTLNGVAYRTDPVSSQTQLVLDGLSAGYQANYMTTNGGLTWGANRRDTGFSANVLPVGNSLAAVASSDIFYQIIRNSTSKSLYTDQGSNNWDNVTPPSFRQDAVNFTIDTGAMNGVSAYGRAVGQKKINASGARLNYLMEYPPNEGSSYLFNGLADTTEGEAFSISEDGNIVFGRSPNTPGGTDLYGYKIVNPGGSQTIAALPEFGNTGGSTSRCVPYGCTADGRYACGMNYRGAERACVWDTGDADTNNWTVTDLNDVAASEGILGSFTALSRAYSIGTNSAGYPVVTGWGAAGGYRRAFVMVLSPAAPSVPQPSITSISGAGTTSVTINYTNTLAGTNYVVQYRTNFNTTNWTSLSPVPAGGTTSSSTDAPPADDPQRFYRVFYVTP